MRTEPHVIEFQPEELFNDVLRPLDGFGCGNVFARLVVLVHRCCSEGPTTLLLVRPRSRQKKTPREYPLAELLGFDRREWSLFDAFCIKQHTCPGEAEEIWSN